MTSERKDSGRRPERQKQEPFFEISPMVLLVIMKFQSQRVHSAILLALPGQSEGMSSRRLRTTLERDFLSGKSVSGSTVAHARLDLEEAGLLARKDGNAVLTHLGSAAVEAFNKYQSELVETLHATRIERIALELGTEAAKTFSEQLSGVSVAEFLGPIPAVLRILKIQSDPLRLAVLQLLDRERGEGIPFSGLRQMVSNSPDVTKAPSSTLSNIITQMEKEGLVRRHLGGHKGTVTISDLGIRSMEALANYIPLSEKLGIALLLERDLNDVLPPQRSRL